MRAALLSLLTILLINAPAPAQDRTGAFEGRDEVWPEYPDPDPNAPDARLRMVFDPISGSQELAVEPGVPFEVYVLAHDVQIALRGWEASLELDPRLKVLEQDVAADLNVGKGQQIHAVLHSQNCLSGPVIEVARLRLVLEEPATDVVLGLGPADASSGPTVPTGLRLPAPVYLTCREDADLYAFDYCDTCVVVNPVDVRPEIDPERSDPVGDLLDPVRGRHR